MKKATIWIASAALPALLAVAGCPNDNYAPMYGVEIDDDDSIGDDDSASEDDDDSATP